MRVVVKAVLQDGWMVDEWVAMTGLLKVLAKADIRVGSMDETIVDVLAE